MAAPTKNKVHNLHSECHHQQGFVLSRLIGQFKAMIRYGH